MTKEKRSVWDIFEKDLINYKRKAEVFDRLLPVLKSLHPFMPYDKCDTCNLIQEADKLNENKGDKNG